MGRLGQSSALLVVRAAGGYGGQSDRLVDLRVDDHPTPIAELERLLGLHRLYFDRPTDDDLIAIDTSLAVELADRLTRVTGQPVDAADATALWERLNRWAGRENLEERMIREGNLDRTVLGILREQTGS